MFEIDEIRSELVSYVNQNPQAFQAALLSESIFLSKYAKRLTKINGEYPSVVALMGNVVQAFYSKKFTPFTDVTFKKKDLRSYRQKVDFLLDPAEILGTIYAYKFEEGKDPKDKLITKETMDMVIAKIIDDLDFLHIQGVYDASKVGIDNPVFGFSMDGIQTTLTKILADVQSPAYLIPGNAVTANNILGEINSFEKKLPAKSKMKVKQIFTSLEDKEEYEEAYDDTYKNTPSFNSADITKTRLGKREIVGVPGLDKGTIFATIDNNLLELVDVVENPGYISGIQVQDRSIKLMSEFSLNYDFAINQYLYVHTADATKKIGLNNAAQNKLFYQNESKIAS
ncbi:hypothetical protein [Chryseobacterium sp. MEBOG07]|uniref:hypothetical protein n=1 Tax=Chryseobacterium sp. MEBOG07 TaxID=2879939 RepID=UPI001F1A8F83|nr:hypothetical protein [Chryseobacterium sp. MEBOG07]UKB81249.1 hypothetical protein LF886_09740 [Chryseobacterium sp. MEBOG07]